MTRSKVARWDWTSGATVPDARLVVCERGNFPSDDPRRVFMGDESQTFVVDVTGRAPCFPSWLIPALHVERQADLEGRRCTGCVDGVAAAIFSGNRQKWTCENCGGTGSVGGLPALLAVKAERRALVVSPREAIDLSRLLAMPHGLDDDPHAAFLLHEVILEGRADARRVIDLLIIAGPIGADAYPLSPEHVESLLGQARAAGVPAVCLVPGYEVSDEIGWLS